MSVGNTSKSVMTYHTSHFVNLITNHVQTSHFVNLITNHVQTSHFDARYYALLIRHAVAGMKMCLHYKHVLAGMKLCLHYKHVLGQISTSHVTLFRD